MEGAADSRLTVNAPEREKFERDGFLVVDDSGVPEPVLDAIVADLEHLPPEQEIPREVQVIRYPNPNLEGDGHAWHRIMDGWRISDHVRKLATSPKMLSLLEDLYGRKPLPFQTLNFKIGTQQRAHSDSIHFSTKPAGFMAGVWVALEDIDESNGPLVYYPGSHRLPEFSMQDVGVAAKTEEYDHYEDFIGDVIEREGIEPEYGTIRKGQCLIWSANLIHGGARQKDRSRTRLSQVTHYFFEGCKYYTPLLSEKDHVHWRDPAWIS